MLKALSNSGLGKLMSLNEDTILREVDKCVGWSSSSVFVLGVIRAGIDGKPKFQIRWVKHVDGNLGVELRKHIGKFKAFRFKFFRSTHTAFERECQIYHDFKPRQNTIHPTRPRHTKFKCPVNDCREVE
jgi:hypothetical protein